MTSPRTITERELDYAEARDREIVRLMREFDLRTSTDTDFRRWVAEEVLAGQRVQDIRKQWVRTNFNESHLRGWADMP